MLLFWNICQSTDAWSHHLSFCSTRSLLYPCWLLLSVQAFFCGPLVCPCLCFFQVSMFAFLFCDFRTIKDFLLVLGKPWLASIHENELLVYYKCSVSCTFSDCRRCCFNIIFITMFSLLFLFSSFSEFPTLAEEVWCVCGSFQEAMHRDQSGRQKPLLLSGWTGGLPRSQATKGVQCSYKFNFIQRKINISIMSLEKGCHPVCISNCIPVVLVTHRNVRYSGSSVWPIACLVCLRRACVKCYSHPREQTPPKRHFWSFSALQTIALPRLEVSFSWLLWRRQGDRLHFGCWCLCCERFKAFQHKCPRFCDHLHPFTVNQRLLQDLRFLYRHISPLPPCWPFTSQTSGLAKLSIIFSTSLPRTHSCTWTQV